MGDAKHVGDFHILCLLAELAGSDLYTSSKLNVSMSLMTNFI